jgi:hypothetical protein
MFRYPRFGVFHCRKIFVAEWGTVKNHSVDLTLFVKPQCGVKLPDHETHSQLFFAAEIPHVDTE